MYFINIRAAPIRSSHSVLLVICNELLIDKIGKEVQMEAITLFCSDLDNTLIYSYKHEIGKEKILVEKKEEKELSYMTKKSAIYLQAVKNKYIFIPITTRSLEQYKRIQFDSNWIPNYALVANGGILLVNGQIEKDWYQETLVQIEHSQEEMERSIALLKKEREVFFEVRKVDGLFVFTKTKNPIQTMEHIKKHLDLEQVSVFTNGQKLYVFPKILNKGNSLNRIKKELKAKCVIAAGDSEFDVPMLKQADIAFIPESLSLHQEACFGKKVICREGVFSDFILEYLLKNLK